MFTATSTVFQTLDAAQIPVEHVLSGRHTNFHFLVISKMLKWTVEIVHSDIMGKLDISFPGRYRYVRTFIDGYSRYFSLGLLHRCSDIRSAFNVVYDKL